MGRAGGGECWRTQTRRLQDTQEVRKLCLSDSVSLTNPHHSFQPPAPGSARRAPLAANTHPAAVDVTGIPLCHWSLFPPLAREGGRALAPGDRGGGFRDDCRLAERKGPPWACPALMKTGFPRSGAWQPEAGSCLLPSTEGGAARGRNLCGACESEASFRIIASDWPLLLWAYFSYLEPERRDGPP